MELCVLGAGYVGLTTAAVLADLGHLVVCADINKVKIKQLENGQIPIFEQGLGALIKRVREKKRLSFTSHVREAISNKPIVLIAVGTPAEEDGRANLQAIDQVLKLLVETITSYKLIITKSTVPPGTNAKMVQKLIADGIPADKFDIVSNPEFLKEGTAVDDSFHPARIVIGSESKRPVATVQALYKKIHAPFVVTSLTGAELIKYASNAFLATKISFINELARICDVYGADILDVEKGIGLDPRIGPHFLHAGLGFGGSCFPKDLVALKAAALDRGVDPALIRAVIDVNQTQVSYYTNQLIKVLGDLNRKKVAVLGITFKPETDDTRSSQSIQLINQLLKRKAEVHVFDPMIDFQAEHVVNHPSVESCAGDAEAIMIATDWPIFHKIDWRKISNLMQGNLVVDCRNSLDPKIIHAADLRYLGVGRT